MWREHRKFSRPDKNSLKRNRIRSITKDTKDKKILQLARELIWAMQDAGYELKTSSIPVAVDINVFDTGNLSVNNVINNVRISEKFDLTK